MDTDAEMEGEPWRAFDAMQRRRRALDDLLEEIADALPDGPRPGVVRLAAALVRWAGSSGAALEERVLYPVVMARLGVAGDGAVVLVEAIGLARRDARDAAARGHELAGALDAHLAGGGGAERLGMLLRGQFEADRCRLDWLDAAVLRPARMVLLPADCLAISAALARILRESPPCDRARLVVVEGSLRRRGQSPDSPARRSRSGMRMPLMPSSTINPSFHNRVI